MRVLAFDLETTSNKPEEARIVEFSFLEMDENLREVSRWTELVHPGMKIPPETVAIHGITDAMVAGKPGFAAFAPRIQVWVQDAILVAHNHEFDLQILHRELARAGERGVDPNHPCIDTLLIERQFHNNRLGTVYKRYTGRDLEGAHRSEADTAATAEVLRQQRVAHAGALPATLEGLLVPNLMHHFGEAGPSRRWLDHGKKYLYMDDAGAIRFGRWSKKHADKALSDVARSDASYLSWMIEKGDFPPEVKSAVRAALPAAGGPSSAPPLPPGS